jgi:hypothetical protein
MVQVDVFWSYGLGAGFAFAAARQLLAEPQPAAGQCAADSDCLLGNRFFSATVLFLALIFAPSGVCLLWAFPSWETMHVGDRNLPAWLVTLFAVTNVTQGMLGFWVVRRLLQKGQRFAAFLQAALGYFLMFFILVHGWDGTGYRRFFSATKELFLDWHWTNALRFAYSNVALTLYLMGLVLIPVMGWMMLGWYEQGAAEAGVAAVDRREAVRGFLASLLIHWLGWLLGFVIFAVLAYFLLLRKQGLLYAIGERLVKLDAAG